MEHLPVLKILTILLSVQSLLSMPTVLKVNKDEQNNLPVMVDSEPLMNDLDRLKEDGISVHKTAQAVSKIVNGKKEKIETHKTEVADAKTGKVVAAISEVSEKKPGETEQHETHIDVPSAGVHKIVSSEAEAEKEITELLPVEVAAQYIYDTSDVESVQKAIEELVQNKRISKKNADEYFDSVKDNLNAMHERALQQFQVEFQEERKQGIRSAFSEMLDMVDTLNKDTQIRSSLYNYVKTLYVIYLTEGDETAKSALNKFSELLQQATTEGHLTEGVEKEVYGIILQAISDAKEESVHSKEGSEQHAGNSNDNMEQTNQQQQLDVPVNELRSLMNNNNEDAKRKH